MVDVKGGVQQPGVADDLPLLETFPSNELDHKLGKIHFPENDPGEVLICTSQSSKKASSSLLVISIGHFSTYRSCFYVLLSVYLSFYVNLSLEISLRQAVEWRSSGKFSFNLLTPQSVTLS